MSSRAGGGVYKVAIQLKDEGGVLKKLEEMKRSGIKIKQSSIPIASGAPVQAPPTGGPVPIGVPYGQVFKEMERLKSGDVRNALRGAVDTGSRARKVLPSATGVEASPSVTTTPIGVQFGQELGGGGIFSKISEMLKKITGQGGEMQALGVGQLAKLSGVALGVGTLVGLTVKSSGVLQGTLKLLEASMMLIFKPIGDTIGLILRPFALMMMAFAIPFYRVAAPFFKDHGAKLAEFLADPVGYTKKDPVGVAKGTLDASSISPVGGAAAGIANLIPLYQQFNEMLGKAWNDFVASATATLANVPSMLWGFFVATGEGIWSRLQDIGSVFWGYLQATGQTIFDTLQNMGQVFWGYLQAIGQSIYDYLVNLPAVFWGYLQAVGQLIFDGLAGLPTTFLDVFTGLAENIASTLAGVPQKIFDAIMSWIKSLIPSGGGGGNVNNASRFKRQRTGAADRVEMQSQAELMQ